MIECDVLIVGSGPAGASLAYFLSTSKLRIILIDKKKIIEQPVRCAEFISKNLAKLFDFKISGINNSIDYMDIYAGFYYPYEITATVSSPGYMLDRAKFVGNIVERFKKNEGTLINCAKIFNLYKYSKEKVISTIFDKKNNKFLKVKSKIVVGADGPSSAIGRYMGSRNEKFLFGIQENIELKFNPIDHIKIFFMPFLKCGYGWIFPKSESVNLGIGIEINDLKNTLIKFKELLSKYGLIIKKNNNLATADKTAGLIPVSGIVKKSVFKNFVLVGDAAGLCHPITGAGIYNAIYSSKLVAPIIVKAIKDNDLKILYDINTTYKNEFGRSLDHALSKRSYLTRNWPEQFPRITRTDYLNGAYEFNLNEKINNDLFLNLIRKTWVTFKEYWKEII